MTPDQLLEQLGLSLISRLSNGFSALAGEGAGPLQRQLPVLLFLGLSFATVTGDAR